ncbi:MAG: HTH domain-containing protein [Bacteroidales bacterium]|nr:HTH domain-containing protein [Bacteroidales bacterium]
MIKSDNNISYRAMASKLEINDSAIKKHINSLKDKGVLERVGGTRGYWKINL